MLFGFAGALRSRTRGRGTFSMTFAAHRIVPERALAGALAASA
jgi:translation elongation factor EF-G